MKKTLILRFSSLGDVAMIVPVIRCLCKKYPNQEFIMVSRKKFKPLFEEHQNLSFFQVDFDNRHKGFIGVFKLFKDLKKIKPNRVADLHHVLRTRIFGGHLNGSKLSTLKLINFVKLIRPDIIHLHQIHGYYLHVPLLFDFLKKYNKPVVWTLHDCWAFTGHCTYFSLERKNCNKWTYECNNCPKINNYPKSIYFIHPVHNT